MKLLLIFLCVCVYEAIGHGPNDGIAFAIVQDKIEKIIEKKCNSKVDVENAHKQFQEARINYFVCESTAFAKQSPNPVDDHELFCTYLKNTGYYTCVESLTKSMELCLDDSEKYLSDIVLNAINSTYDEFCGANGLSNSKLLYDMSKDSTCSRDLFVRQLQCLGSLSAVANIKDDGVINLNKIDVCNDLQAIQPCFTDALKASCDTDYNALGKLLDAFFDPITKDCNDTENEIKN